MLIGGADEAGRGPLMGPLVVAGVSIDDSNMQALIDIGVKDSKLLSVSSRERMYGQIIKAAKDYKIIIILPDEVDSAVSSENLNLNKLEGIKYAMITNYLKPEKMIVDCPSNNIIAFVEFFKMNLTMDSIDIVAEHKADVKYPVVSAASILAKVTRDREIEKLKEKYGVDFGSGYPADPKTVEFARKNWGNPKYSPLFRKTWETYKRFERAKDQKKLGQF